MIAVWVAHCYELYSCVKFGSTRFKYHSNESPCITFSLLSYFINAVLLLTPHSHLFKFRSLVVLFTPPPSPSIVLEIYLESEVNFAEGMAQINSVFRGALLLEVISEKIADYWND